MAPHVAKYINGVGSTGNWLSKIVGGALGAGLVARILRGYTFISRNYAPGDKIFVIGFSRGAYTARALAGLIAAKGLLDWQGLGLAPGAPDDDGYKYAAAAWNQRMRERLKGKLTLLGGLEQMVSTLPQLIGGAGYTPKFVANVRIAGVAVWDTVGALGIPRLTTDHTETIDYLQFADTKLSDKVDAAFHAIAIDEQRIDFSPTLWDTGGKADPRIAQRLFAGAHADVGGGYPLGVESYLSDLSWRWMAEQLAGQGVDLSLPVVQEDYPLGPSHKPWTNPAFAARPIGARVFPPFDPKAGALPLHESVGHRLSQKVQAISATSPPATQDLAYVPSSLVNAGYLQVFQRQA